MTRIRNKTYILYAVLLCCCIYVSSAFAQQVDISSSLNPVGSGARATGMGGAFIGVSDDATAASWNPAGLIQLEKPEVSAVYSYFQRKQVYDSLIRPEIASDNTMDADGLNYASIAYPFNLLNRNMIISLNYQRLFELNKEVRFDLNRQVLGFTLTDDIEFVQDGFLYALSPAYALEITPEFSLGATLNIWDNILGENGWDNTYNSVLSGSVLGSPVEVTLRANENVSFKGLNAHIGFLWEMNTSWTLGGVYKTAFDADLTMHTFFQQDINPPVTGTENLVMQMPSSYGLGISYRHSDNLTIAFDIFRTDWSRFIIRNEDGSEVNPLDGRPVDEGRLKDTTQIRLGAEYLFIKRNYILPLRCGLFYDPEPSKGGLDEFYGFSAGIGYARGRTAFDISYQFRQGNNVTGDIPSVEGSSADIRQHIVMFSLVFYLQD